MKCPNCNSETSEMASACEWCGAPVQAPAQNAPMVPGTGGAFFSPGDAGGYGFGQPAPGGPPAQPSNSWYHSPWPFLVALVLLVAIIGGVLVMRKATPVSKTGGTFADFVIGGKPTLVDFYTDT